MNTPVVRRPGSWARWLRLSSLLAIGACRLWSGEPEETDSAESVDSDTDSVGPCGEGRPADCEEVRDGVCLFREIPSYFVQSSALPSNFEDLNSAPPTGDPMGAADTYCGLSARLACGAYLADVWIDGVGAMESGFPAVGEPGYFLISVWNATTRHQAAVGIVAGPPGGPGCPVAWYGDAEALPCLFHGLDIARANYGSCILNTGDPCPFCSCRINEINPAEVCAQPSPAE